MLLPYLPTLKVRQIMSENPLETDGFYCVEARIHAGLVDTTVTGIRAEDCVYRYRQNDLTSGFELLELNWNTGDSLGREIYWNFYVKPRGGAKSATFKLYASGWPLPEPVVVHFERETARGIDINPGALRAWYFKHCQSAPALCAKKSG